MGRRVAVVKAVDEGAGPAVSFEEFYRAQWASMVRLGWLLTGSREVAEDVVQDAFVAVRDGFERIESPVAYLRVAVVNGVRARARRLRRAARWVPDPVRPVLIPEFDEMWRYLARLPGRQRQALVLRFYEDLSFAEVAELLDCRVATARSLVHRGLAALRLGIDR